MSKDYAASYYQNNRTEIVAKGKARRLKGRYGLTVIQYLYLFESQQYRCAACAKPFGQIPHVDHDHSTGKVRGILCERCNWIAGPDKSRVIQLLQVLNYIERSS